MGTRPLPRVLLAALAAMLLAFPATAPAASKPKPRLKAFKDCSSLIRYGNRHVPQYTRSIAPAPAPMPVSGGIEDSGRPVPAAAPGVSQDATQDVSTTNNQEAGVDEADTVKTDGRTIWSVDVRGMLHAVDVTGPAPKLVSTLDVGSGYGHQLLRQGDRLLVMWTRYRENQNVASAGQFAPSPAPSPMPIYFDVTVTRLALVDVADPAKPVLLRTLDVDGDLIAARLTGQQARVVIAATPRAFAEGPVPTAGGGGLATASAKKVSRRHANAWLPAGTFRNLRTKARKRRALIPCRAVRHPRAFSGLDTLTVLTIDPAKGLEPVDSDGLMSGGETVYASEDNLYVATRRYVKGLELRTRGEAPDATTEIHRFETSGASTTYRGSGRVPGYLLSQFAMSEHAGVLRVASTKDPPWFTSDASTSSQVTTLRLGEASMPQVGEVGGLGKGERIFAVRFIDDAGYVVTYRQVDPLYTLDLSDPANPRVAGELKILGYSAYLHPAGDGQLIGVGQDGTEEGRRLGTAVSLFDVSDPAAPKVLQRATVGGSSSSTVEWDHHAFLWWPKTRLAVIPVQLFDAGPEPGPGPDDSVSSRPYQQGFTGAIGFTVRPEGIAELGRVSHPGASYTPEVTRSLVVGDRLYTLSDLGIKASRLDTLADVGFVPFDQP